MSVRTKAEVLLAFLEYRAYYGEPLFQVWGQPGILVQALYRAFREWDVQLENITAKDNPANESEVQVNFSLLNRSATFAFGVGSARLVVTNPNWSEAELFVRLARAGLNAVIEAGHAQIDRQELALSMHLRPKGRSVVELTTSLAPPTAHKVLTTAPRGFGFSVYGDQSSCVVDLSASYVDTLFVRMTRTFGGTVRLEELAQELAKDQTRVLEILDLETD